MNLSEERMTIKNPNKIHYIRNKKYLCIHAVSPTKEKSTKNKDKVTCKNCLMILKGEEEKIYFDYVNKINKLHTNLLKEVDKFRMKCVEMIFKLKEKSGSSGE